MVLTGPGGPYSVPGTRPLRPPRGLCGRKASHSAARERHPTSTKQTKPPRMVEPPEAIGEYASTGRCHFTQKLGGLACSVEVGWASQATE